MTIINKIKSVLKEMGVLPKSRFLFLDKEKKHRIVIEDGKPFALTVTGLAGSGKTLFIKSILNQFRNGSHQVFYMSDDIHMKDLLCKLNNVDIFSCAMSKEGIVYNLESECKDRLKLCMSSSLLDSEVSIFSEKSFSDFNFFLLRSGSNENILFNLWIKKAINHLISSSHPKVLFIDESHYLFEVLKNEIINPDGVNVLGIVAALMKANTSIVISAQQLDDAGTYEAGKSYENIFNILKKNKCLNFNSLLSEAELSFCQGNTLQIGELKVDEAFLNFKDKILWYYHEEDLHIDTTKPIVCNVKHIGIKNYSERDIQRIILEQEISKADKDVKVFKI